MQVCPPNEPHGSPPQPQARSASNNRIAVATSYDIKWRFMRALLLVFIWFWALSTGAHADTVLRMAGMAPDGSSWTRELKAFSREVEARTHGHVRLKWYWGGIAGDEAQVFERIRRDQLDGQAAAQACERVAPSLRITRVLGLFQSRDETLFVLRRISDRLDQEVRKNSFVGFFAGMGSDIMFTRGPVRDLAELKKTRMWLWDLDELMRVQLEALGLQPVRLPVADALAAYEDGRSDGFFAIPTAALAYQWSARAHYFTELRLGFLSGCLLLANRAFDSLSIDEQQAFRDAAAGLVQRFEELGRSEDEKLLHGLFQKQGLRSLSPSATFRSEFFAAAEEARQHIPPSLVAPDLLQKVGGWLADYRAQHR
jgi:TRAP-type C4-dicarboxylate transport system substrate-binding protein